MKNNKILIAIAAIILALLIYFIVSADYNLKFNKVNFNDNNVVLNQSVPKYMDTIVLAGLHVLDCENTKVMIKKMDSFNISDVNVKAYIIRYDFGYIIWIKDLSKMEAMLVLSHELVHLKQYDENRLVIMNNSIIWNKDDVYHSGEMPEYSQRPWEIEAFENQNDVKNKIEDILLN
jgi:hypothetical protein